MSHIAKLIVGHILGTITPEYQDELDEWAGKSECNMELLLTLSKGEPKDEVMEESEYLMLSFITGESAGFNYFYSLHRKPLFYFARKLMRGDNEKATDAVNDAFVKVWRAREAVIPDWDKLKSYLFAAVKNTCFTKLKKKSHPFSVDLDHVNEISENGKTVECVIMEAESLLEIKATVRKLPKGASDVIDLYFLEGKSVAEIMEILKVSKSTVKNQRARGIMLLQRLYNQTK